MSHTAEIIAVGTELLLGNIANTNAQEISESLSTLGINVFWHTVAGDNPQRLREALDIARKSLEAVMTACDDSGFGHLTLCPETMGKINQLGDLDEVLELCTLDERLIPCIDFGHLYARSLGADDGQEAFARMLDRVEEVLGTERASRFHSHFSHIEFTPKGGEKCHRTFADDGGFGPDWGPLAAETARRGWSPTFICESAGTQAEDALEMKKIYQEMLSAQG